MLGVLEHFIISFCCVLLIQINCAWKIVSPVGDLNARPLCHESSALTTRSLVLNFFHLAAYLPQKFFCGTLKFPKTFLWHASTVFYRSNMGEYSAMATRRRIGRIRVLAKMVILENWRDSIHSPTFANLFWSDSIHLLTFAKPFCSDSPDSRKASLATFTRI